MSLLNSPTSDEVHSLVVCSRVIRCDKCGDAIERGEQHRLIIDGASTAHYHLYCPGEENWR